MGKYNRKKDSNARSIVYSEDGETIYGQVGKAMGSGRFEVICSDSMKRLCKIRGALQRRVKISPDDIVLVAFRMGDPRKGDIVHKYYPDEVKILKESREIPENFTEDANILNIEFDNI